MEAVGAIASSQKEGSHEGDFACGVDSLIVEVHFPEVWVSETLVQSRRKLYVAVAPFAAR